MSEADRLRAERDEAREWAQKLAVSLTAMVNSYDNMPGLGASNLLYQYERAMNHQQPPSGGRS